MFTYRQFVYCQSWCWTLLDISIAWSLAGPRVVFAWNTSHLMPQTVHTSCWIFVELHFFTYITYRHLMYWPSFVIILVTCRFLIRLEKQNENYLIWPHQRGPAKRGVKAWRHAWEPWVHRSTALTCNPHLFKWNWLSGIFFGGAIGIYRANFGQKPRVQVHGKNPYETQMFCFKPHENGPGISKSKNLACLKLRPLRWNPIRISFSKDP